MPSDLLNPERFELRRTEPNRAKRRHMLGRTIFRTKNEEQGLRLFGLYDTETGITATYPEPNPDVDYSTTVAWVGANTSRNGATFEDCFIDLNSTLATDPRSAANKFGNVFANYGHASVGDMATVPLMLDNIPAYIAYRFFSATSLGSGQEWSTRYGKKDKFDIPAISKIVGQHTSAQLEARWQVLQDSMARMYGQSFAELRQDLADYLQKNGVNIEPEDKGELAKINGTLNARSLDVARMYLPFGIKTKQIYVDSARDWVRLAGQFRQSTDPAIRAFGEHITAMLLLDQRDDASDVALHLDKFTKYAEGTKTAETSIRELGRFVLKDLADVAATKLKGAPHDATVTSLDLPEFDFESQRVIFSALCGLYPEIDRRAISYAIGNLSPAELEEASRLMFEGHNQHDMMHQAFDIRGIAYLYETAVAYLRDINRHRSFGRHVIQFTAEDKPLALVEKGWNNNFQLNESEYWAHRRDAFDSNMDYIFNEIYEIVEEVQKQFGPHAANAVLNNIMPLGAQMEMVLSAPVQQWNYMTSLRVGLGGDFGYRNDVWKMLGDIRHRDPGLRHMASHLTKPDVNSAEQIVGRS